MADDFFDAYYRHWKDAELLYGHQRWASADHLYGIAAECGLKCLMLYFRSLPNLPYEDKKHLDITWNRYETYRSGALNGAAFPLPSPNPFANWTIHQRYWHQSRFSQKTVAPHQSGAQYVETLLSKAKKLGYI